MRRVGFGSVVIFLVACRSSTAIPSSLARGTWGGDNAGMIVEETVVHIHIACTYGNAPRPGTLSNGRFEITGSYNITAHPVDLGVFHPATIRGHVREDWMSFTVELSDTNVSFGPVIVVYSREPRMQQCPICRNPRDSERMPAGSF